MKRKSIQRTAVSLALSVALLLVLVPLTAAPVEDQKVASERVVVPTDRTVLPIPEPQYPHRSRARRSRCEGSAALRD